MKTLFPNTTHFFSVCVLVFLFAGCSGDTKSIKSKNEEVKTSAATDTTTQLDENGQSDSNLITETLQPDSTTATETPDDTTTTPSEPAKPDPVKPTNTSGGLTDRAADTDRLSIVLDNISQDIEAQNLAYIIELGQDCSGIYHKIKDILQKKMSTLGDLTKYTYPVFEKERNTRQIAYWYHQKGNLHIVHDALADVNNIRPGTVMFYGRTDEKYDNLNIEMLSNPGKFVHDPVTGLGKIFHIAIVTKVEKDDAGNVEKYTIMHGRNSRKVASRSGANYDGLGGYKKQHADFPFGNWNQQWVAMANIETEVN